MKKTILLAGAVLALGFVSCNGKGDSAKTFDDSLSYYLGSVQGMSLNQNIQRMPKEEQDKVDRDAFLLGLKTAINADTTQNDYLTGLQMGVQVMGQVLQMEKAGIKFNRDVFFAEFKKAFLADSVNSDEFAAVNEKMGPLYEKAMNAMMAERARQQAIEQQKNQEKFEANKAKGKKFLDEKIKADKSIKVTESGLAYKVTKMGKGAVAKEGDRVNVKYTGKTIDGKEFDSSKGQEVAFPTNGLIKGFGEALTTLPAGTVVTLYIPENIAYGSQGTPDIEPGSTLIFDVEIGEVQETPTAAPAAGKAAAKPANAK